MRWFELNPGSGRAFNRRIKPPRHRLRWRDVRAWLPRVSVRR